MSDAFLAEHDVHFVGDAGSACDARLRRVGGTQRITSHSVAASLLLTKLLHCLDFYDIFCMNEVTMMVEQGFFCTYLKQLVDSGLCYDLQMISNGFIKPSVLPDLKIDKTELIRCCMNCEHKD